MNWKTIVEITDAEQEKNETRMKRNEYSLRDLWDIEYTNIPIIPVPDREDREKGSENIFEDILAENVPNLVKETNTQVQEV